MNKAQIISHLHRARPEHVLWVKEGRKLVKGLPEEQIKKPLSCDVCNFTRWYEIEGHKLVNIPQLKAIQELHHEIHTAYTSLYFTTFDRRNKARATIISGGVEIPIDELPFRRKKLKVLETKTIKLLKSLLVIEQKVEAMQEQDFENGWLV
ncbi:MAG: CZB domain-containing protein [Cocleimonas sp.]